MTPQPASPSSSAWLIIGIESEPAYSSALRMSAPLPTATPSSEKATQPASLSSAISVSILPLSPALTAPTGRMFIPVSSACLIMKRVTEPLSLTGFVLAMHRMVVKPPAFAASAPVFIVSLYSKPGSLRCVCTSISPGVTTMPPASMMSSPGAPGTSSEVSVADSFIEAILPPIMYMLDTSSSPIEGSTTLPPFMTTLSIYQVPRIKL